MGKKTIVQNDFRSFFTVFLCSDYRAEIASDTIESQCGRVLQIAVDQTKGMWQKRIQLESYRQFSPI